MFQTNWKCAACDCGPCYFTRPRLSKAENASSGVWGVGGSEFEPFRCPLGFDEEADVAFDAVDSPVESLQKMWATRGELENDAEIPVEIWDALAAIESEDRRFLDVWRALDRVVNGSDDWGYEAETRETFESATRKFKRAEMFGPLVRLAFATGVLWDENRRAPRCKEETK